MKNERENELKEEIGNRKRENVSGKLCSVMHFCLCTILNVPVNNVINGSCYINFLIYS